MPAAHIDILPKKETAIFPPTGGKTLSPSLNVSCEELTIHKQTLLERPVLGQRPLLPYVPAASSKQRKRVCVEC